MNKSNLITEKQDLLITPYLKRMPVIMKRIGMILTGLRLDTSKPLPDRMVCSDDDFETMLLIGHKLLMHAAIMF